mmetsp:Transcript_6047/g.16093  ORF Transcript_6047/g.16093 Transcript_6047/m.16093 type:complete len:218 (+) Transcript_6047:168-821(+)
MPLCAALTGFNAIKEIVAGFACRVGTVGVGLQGPLNLSVCHAAIPSINAKVTTISKANSGLLGLYTSVKIAGANSDDVIGQEILNNSRCLDYSALALRQGLSIHVVPPAQHAPHVSLCVDAQCAGMTAAHRHPHNDVARKCTCKDPIWCCRAGKIVASPTPAVAVTQKGVRAHELEACVHSCPLVSISGRRGPQLCWRLCYGYAAPQAQQTRCPQIR